MTLRSNLFLFLSSILYSRYLCFATVDAADTTRTTADCDRGTVWRYEPSRAWCRGRSLLDGCGPHWWSKLDGNEACALTMRSKQSPIDIVSNDAEYSGTADETLLEFEAKDGGCRKWNQFATKAVFQSSFEDAECSNLSVKYQGNEYEFKQFHFHSPSEHTIDGKYSVAELHMVHIAEDGSILVIGVLFDLGDELFPPPDAPFLSQLWESGVSYNTTAVDAQLPLNPCKFRSWQSLPLNLSLLVLMRTDADLLQDDKNVFFYSGSLTTPPCTEGVQWFVFARPRILALKDLTNLRRVVLENPDSVISEAGDNNRPLQPLLRRTVQRNFETKMRPKSKPQGKTLPDTMH